MKSFQFGKAVLKYAENGEALLVLPIAGVMVAVKVSLFDHDQNSSVNIQTDIYDPKDITVVGKVQRWIREIETQSTNS